MPAWRRIEAASNRPSQGGAHYRRFVPGIEGDNRLWWHRRQISGLPQHAAPFLQPLFLVSVEIADQGALAGARPGIFACSIAACERARTASIGANSSASGPASSSNSTPAPAASPSGSGPVGSMTLPEACSIADPPARSNYCRRSERRIPLGIEIEKTKSRQV